MPRPQSQSTIRRLLAKRSTSILSARLLADTQAKVLAPRHEVQRGFALKVVNPTHGSGWIVQMLSTRKLPSGVEIPPTAVGGSFKSFLREDLKYPPTAVGGIIKGFRAMSVEGT